MKMKFFMILLVMLSLVVAGCVDDTETPTEENASMNDSMTDAANDTVAENTDNVSVEESGEEEEEVISDEEDETLEVIEYEGAKSYTVYMRNFNVQPHNLTINEGDSVIWFNDNDPVRTFTLVSGEGLWENVSIVNRRNFIYTFNESGTFTYSVKTWDVMKGTIIVK
ncbi:MAG: hypothetical protein PWQ51_712 [Methanolobus sp.]|uniref:Plastocyanin n=1 Tax=Methanolobus tindarius DSM 2278 TaxID=1090322 RepID=W9DNQ9_METTI|nr:plastocyanin [Methanolobus tindarius]ETA66638.1 plastocyanin [Methanolobus tindarius DSM 2278]MDI3487234.1 hypothetical protein [Methanolobus sp.]MDK2938548.1 hypothetical protein [Methanolobus sp.]